MSKALKTILIISIAIFAVGFLLVSPTNAQANGLVVEYWTGTEWLPLTGPIFSETNFLPGQSVTRLVRVTNNSGTTQRIATEAINYPKPIPDNDLSRALMIVIKQGGTDLYGGSSPAGPKTLYDFYQDSEAYPEIALSDLNNGATTQYDFIISFPAEKENEWQGETTRFDILIGFQGTASPYPPSPPAPLLGGGFLPAGLTIIEGTVTIPEGAIGETSVTITWTTSYSSTSQVIYAAAAETYSFDLTKPNYGYPHAAPVPEDSAKVTFHSVTIIGLTPGTTYYYRTVSHGSLAISREYSFTTKGVAGGAIEEKPAEAIGIPGITGETPEETTEEGIPSAPLAQEKTVTVAPQRGLASLLAALGMVIGQSAWKMIFVILSLMGLILIGAKEWKKAREKKRG